MNVYLLWDKDREEHGENPELLDIYATHELAQEALEKQIDYSDIEEDMDPQEIADMVEAKSDYFSIEEREVKNGH